MDPNTSFPLPPLKYFIIELEDFLNRRHMDHVVTIFFPKIDIHGLIALGASIPPVPGAEEQFLNAVEAIEPDLYQLIDLSDLEYFFVELVQIISFKLQGYGPTIASNPPLFMKWMGEYTICLAGYDEPEYYPYVQQHSKQAVELFLRQSRAMLGY